jgi:glucose-6-phosphate 1-dehydrogenase
VVQNHLLQVVELLAMEPPTSGFADAIRDEKVKVLKAIHPLSPRQLARDIDSWRWAGVPFLICTAKSLSVTATEVRVTLRRSPQHVFAGIALEQGMANSLRFRLGTDAAIAIGACTRKPGDDPREADTLSPGGWHEPGPPVCS